MNSQQTWISYYLLGLVYVHCRVQNREGSVQAWRWTGTDFPMFSTMLLNCCLPLQSAEQNIPKKMKVAA